MRTGASLAPRRTDADAHVQSWKEDTPSESVPQEDDEEEQYYDDGGEGPIGDVMHQRELEDSARAAMEIAFMKEHGYP